METKVINIHSGEKYDTYIGRGGRNSDGYYGNPHIIGFCKICQRHHDRKDAIETFRQEFISRINREEDFKKLVESLRGKTLGCFCKPDACHGDIYVDYLEHPEKYLAMKKLKIAVIGSRTFTDKDRLYRILNKNKDKIEMIISGGAQGADLFSELWANERGIPSKIYRPEWRDKQGNFDKGAGFKRNHLIIKDADKVLCFWDGESKGTKNSLEWAEKLNKPVILIKFTPPPPEKKREEVVNVPYS